MKKNVLILLLAACLVLPMTAACGSNAAVSEGTSAASQDVSGDVSAAASTNVSSGDSNASTASSSSSSTASSSSAAVTAETTSDVIRISIPEGYTLAKICLLLESKGINSFDKLFSYATSDNFSQYSFLPAASSTPNRCFQLEGYLYPDTYDFFLNESPASVWKKFLDNFEQHAVTFSAEAEAKDLTLDQAVVIASLIEKESDAAERANVSAVIHNRLAQNMTLDIDSTYTYYHYIIEEYVKGDLTNYYNNYYTYIHKGLPAGAICNPGSSAMEAAINPSGIQSLYFFTDKSGVFVYSDTLEEHESKAIAAGVIVPTTAPTPAA